MVSLSEITPNRVAYNAFISVIGKIKPNDMKALIQKGIIRTPISRNEDINGRMESETTLVRILGVIVFKKIIQLLKERQLGI